jgi:hypothetical protein
LITDKKILYICGERPNAFIMKMRFKSLGGLRVKDGRLINDRPDGITGIAQASQLKKSAYRAKKVDMLADGIELAEGRKNFYRL